MMQRLLKLPKLYVDIETWREPWEGPEGLLMVGYALDDAPVETPLGVPSPQLLDFLADDHVAKVAHSAYDVRWLLLAGVPVAGPLFDTQVMAWVWNENTPLSLEWLVKRYVGVQMDKRLRRSKGEVWFVTDEGERILLADIGRHFHELTDVELIGREVTSEWPYETAFRVVMRQMRRYNGDDVEQLRSLYLNLEERLVEGEWVDYWLDEEVPYTSMLRRMETRGMPVDLEASERLRAELEVENETKRVELLEEGGLPSVFNLNSADQLVAYLFSLGFELKAELVYDRETIECIKSCLDGEHEDCEYDDGEHDQWFETHIVDLLPDRFVVDKLGRDRVHGHWFVKGRGLAPTPPPVDKKTGEVGKQPSTSSPELLYMHGSDPWVHKLCMEYRKVRKLLTTYLRKYPQLAVEVVGRGPQQSDPTVVAEATASSRIYGRFNQTGTVTGRLSSSEPNLQNQPSRGELGKKVRRLFVGNLILADYDQLEMRLMAHFSEDPVLLETFRLGENPHIVTAEAIFGPGIEKGTDQYDIGKRVNFGVGYGAGPRKVAQVLSLEGFPTTVEEAKMYLDAVHDMMPGYFEWKEGVVTYAKRRGYVSTLAGRHRRLKGSFQQTAGWKQRGYGERQAVNAVIQGSAADIIRRAMVKLETVVPEARMLAQVHDELVFEYDPEDLWPNMLDAIKETAELDHGFDLAVPLVFEPVFAHSWAEKEGGALDLFDEGSDDV